MTCNHVRFVGGGRWATIVLTELVQAFPRLTIDWVCNSDPNKQIPVIKGSSSFKNVNLIDNKNIEKLAEPDKVVIASHSSQHCRDLRIHGNGGTDVLIEKPLFPAFSDFETLSECEMRRIFLNMEFHNAYFISDFFNEVKSLDFEHIGIVWHDPLMENRSSEESKSSEIYSSIFMDQLLHVMSICKVMKLETNNVDIIRIVTDDDSLHGGVEIYCEFGSVMMCISLSRFAENRERKIVVDGGAVSLDFSSKPIIQKNGELLRKISAAGRLFPIAQTLTDFLTYPENRDALSLSLKSLLPEIEFCFECEDLFVDYISDQLDSYDEEKWNSGKVNPSLVYYAGILYYRQIGNSMSNPGIHYLRGDKGVKELLRWWHSTGSSQ